MLDIILFFLLLSKFVIRLDLGLVKYMLMLMVIIKIINLGFVLCLVFMKFFSFFRDVFIDDRF